MEPANNLLTDLFAAYYAARENKRNTYAQVKFESRLVHNLMKLYNEIISGRYKISRSTCFIVDEKVKREIFAASFRDRIIHHLLFNYLNPLWEPQFIEDSYSCRKGKGTLYGAKRLHEHMLKAIKKADGRKVYVLKLDIMSYFLSINRRILFDLVSSRMDPSDERYGVMYYLLKETVFNNPTRNCRIKGSLSDWDGYPKHKSLFYAKKHCGLPIGNLTSQLFSNIYLSLLDDFVVKELGFEHYGRYVDDFYIISEEKDRLLDSIGHIKKFLSERLELELHPNKLYLQECSKGVTFVGYYITPEKFVTDRRTAKRLKNHITDAMTFEDNPYQLRNILASCRSYMRS